MTRPPPAPVPLRRRVQRQLRRHRRTLAAGCLALGVGAGLLAVSPPTPPAVTVVVAARDLSGGMPLRAPDLRLLRLPPGAAPAGSVGDPRLLAGRVLAGDVRAREPITDARLVGARLVGGSGLVVSAVRIADAGAAALLRAGDRVDVLAAAGADPVTGGSGFMAQAVTVAAGVRVLALPASSSGGAGTQRDGALVVLATTPLDARALAGADASARLSVVVLS